MRDDSLAIQISEPVRAVHLHAHVEAFIPSLELEALDITPVRKSVMKL